MIIENCNYDDIRKLFKDNNEDYITKWSNEYGIEDQRMLKLVCNENNISKGYAIICFDKNFCEIEEYPNRIENMPEKIAYIWEILVDKKYAGQGIGSLLLKYIIDKFPKHTFYSCIEKENIASIKLYIEINDVRTIFYKKGCVLMDEKRNEIILFENQGVKL